MLPVFSNFCINYYRYSTPNVILNLYSSCLPLLNNCLCMLFSLLCPGNLRLSIMPCWPRPVSTTTVETTLSLAQPAENTTGCAHWPLSTLVSVCHVYMPNTVMLLNAFLLPQRIGYIYVRVEGDVCKNCMWPAFISTRPVMNVAMC